MSDLATLPAEAAAARAGSPDAAVVYSVLCVDDESNILNALRRLFRPAGYRIHVATGGAEALEIIERESIDIVISDMRMPEMNGAQLLTEVRRRRPKTTRILLTGYSDIGSTIEAVNQGELHRYISKPWNDQEVLLIVREACERKALEHERERLEALTHRQNAELVALNGSLEARVVERTSALQKAKEELESAHEKLKSGFMNTIKVFSGLIEMRAGAMAGHSRRVADHARKIAQALKLPAQESLDVFFAALLHDIGKIGLSDAILNKPYSALTPEERSEVAHHPQKGEAVLMGLEQLRSAARLIRSHHERWDGLGFPERVGGLAIPRGARIIAVADDYDGLLYGTLTTKRASPEEARELLRAGRGKRYDPQVIDAFLGVLQPAEPAPSGTSIGSDRLQPGMVLAADLVTRDGVLLLACDFVLNEMLIRQIVDFEEYEGYRLKIAIKEQPK